jgi:hypothetical protein
MNDKTPLGYVVCKTCMTPKAIFQGSGKRANYVYSRCECGSDNRTGAKIQQALSQYKPLEEVQLELDSLNKPIEANPEPMFTPIESESEALPDSESDSLSGSESKAMNPYKAVGVVAVVGLVIGGVMKAIKAVA